MQTFIAYYRVSTKKQGQSGLGLDAQRSSVLSFVKDQTLLVAQQERKMIGEQTKKALDEKLLRVGQWRKGSNSFLKPEVSVKATESNRARAATNENNRKASELIHALLAANLSYAEMARRLNRAGSKTARNGRFQATQVMRLAKQQVND